MDFAISGCFVHPHDILAEMHGFGATIATRHFTLSSILPFILVWLAHFWALWPLFLDFAHVARTRAPFFSNITTFAPYPLPFGRKACIWSHNSHTLFDDLHHTSLFLASSCVALSI